MTDAVCEPRYSPAARIAANRCYLGECERDLSLRSESFSLFWRSRSGAHVFNFCSAQHGFLWLEKHPEERGVER